MFSTYHHVGVNYFLQLDVISCFELKIKLLDGIGLAGGSTCSEDSYFEGRRKIFCALQIKVQLGSIKI